MIYRYEIGREISVDVERIPVYDERDAHLWKVSDRCENIFNLERGAMFNDRSHSFRNMKKLSWDFLPKLFSAEEDI